MLKKIDRIMANMEFKSFFIGACGVFQPYCTSDHTPAVLRIPMNIAHKPKPFKFYNLLVHDVKFLDVVANGWKNDVSGFWMYKVVKKLKQETSSQTIAF